MEKQQLLKANASSEKPKKPFFSPSGCIVALVFLVLVYIGIDFAGIQSYRQRGYDATAKTDVKNAYTAAQAYFTDYPGSNISLSKLTSYGFIQTNNVNLVILSGKKPDLEITSTHSEGTKTYTVNSDGEISF